MSSSPTPDLGAPAPDSAPASSDDRRERAAGNGWAWLDERANIVGLTVATVGLIVLFSILSPNFLTLDNFKVIGVAVSITGIMACFTTIVLISGGLDLSIGAVAALGGLAAAAASAGGIPLPLALLAGIGAGVVAGLVNATLIVGLGVNALIATIGTQFMIRGVDFLVVNGQPVVVFDEKDFLYIGNGEPLGVPMPIFIMFFAFVLVGVLMRFTRFGSRVYATGGSERAARLAGVRVGRLRVIVYVLSAASAALAGIVLSSLNRSAFPDVGTGLELQVIAAVILGGTALMGGRGKVIGTALGVALLGILANGLNILGVQAFWQTFVAGAALVLAVSFDALRNRLRQEV
jgi:ribose transport system permease protein